MAWYNGKDKKVYSNEATKAISVVLPVWVFVGEDVTPPEIVAHIPALCEE